MREPLADEFLSRERVTDAKRTRLACDSAVERFENIVEGPSLQCSSDQKSDFLEINLKAKTFHVKTLLAGVRNT